MRALAPDGTALRMAPGSTRPGLSPTIFLAYARDDHEIAQFIAAHLVKQHLVVLQEDPKRRDSPDIDEVLARCKYIVVLVSPASMRSTTVRRIGSLADDQRKTITPVLIAESEIPLWLSDRQRFDMRADREAAVERLAKSIRVSESRDDEVGKSREANQSLIFIGSTSETRAVARTVVSYLREHGFRTWLAEEDIRPGERWTDAIGDALTRSDAMVALLSPASGRSSFQSLEWRYMLRFDKPLLQVFVKHPVRPPFELADHPWLDLTASPDALQQLPGALHKLLGES